MNSNKLYDLTLINEMASGSQEFVNSLVSLFLETVPENIKVMNGFYESKDFDSLGKEAHKLKSTIRTIKVPGLVDEVVEIEKICKFQGDYSQLDPLMNKLITHMPVVLDQMKEELS